MESTFDLEFIRVESFPKIFVDSFNISFVKRHDLSARGLNSKQESPAVLIDGLARKLPSTVVDVKSRLAFKYLIRLAFLTHHIQTNYQFH